MQLQIQKERELIGELRVLLIDDVEDSRELVEMYLKLHKAKVVALDKAKDALESIGNFQPELIIQRCIYARRRWLLVNRAIKHH